MLAKPSKQRRQIYAQNKYKCLSNPKSELPPSWVHSSGIKLSKGGCSVPSAYSALAGLVAGVCYWKVNHLTLTVAESALMGVSLIPRPQVTSILAADATLSKPCSG